MADKTAKLFVNGGRQAVRLPAEFRFDGTDEVFIRRDAVSGDVILSATRHSRAWGDFFALRDQADVRSDFMNDRPLNEPLKPRISLDEQCDCYARYRHRELRAASLAWPVSRLRTGFWCNDAEGIAAFHQRKPPSRVRPPGGFPNTQPVAYALRRRCAAIPTPTNPASISA